MRSLDIVFCVATAPLLGQGADALAAEATSRPATQTSSSAQLPLPASLPVKRGAISAPDAASWSPGVAVLAIAGAAGGFWLWRRGFGRNLIRGVRAGANDSAVMRLSSQPLTPHASVHAVQWKGEEYLIACTAQNVTLLSRKGASHDSERVQ